MSQDTRSSVPRYRRLAVKTWAEPWFRDLSQMAPSAQGLYLALATGPTTSVIPGLVLGGAGTIADVVRWPVPSTRRLLSELVAKGVAVVADDAHLVFLPHALEANPPESPNVARGWGAALLDVPASPIRVRLVELVRASLRAKGVSWLQAFDDAASIASGGRERDASESPGEPSPEAASGASAKAAGDAAVKARGEASRKPSGRLPGTGTGEREGEGAGEGDGSADARGASVAEDDSRPHRTPRQSPAETAARRLSTTLGSSLNPCRKQITALASAGWDLVRIDRAIDEHAEPGLAPWDWTKRARGAGDAKPASGAGAVFAWADKAREAGLA